MFFTTVQRSFLVQTYMTMVSVSGSLCVSFAIIINFAWSCLERKK